MPHFEKRFMSASGNRRASVLEDVRAACIRLAGSGWSLLLAHHGLDLSARDFKAELLRPLVQIDRTLPGFSYFAVEATRAIEPGQPARSLLYHAFASPMVLRDATGADLKDFPTPEEIEAVENLVYGIDPPSIEELRARAGDAPLAIVVYSYE